MLAREIQVGREQPASVEIRHTDLDPIIPAVPLTQSGIALLHEAAEFAHRRRQARLKYLGNIGRCKSAVELSELQLEFASRALMDYFDEPLVMYHEIERQVLRTLPERWHQISNLVSAEFSQFEYCPESDKEAPGQPATH